MKNANKSTKGIRIGRYLITPLGIGTLAGLIVIIAAVVVFFVADPFEMLAADKVTKAAAPEVVDIEEKTDTAETAATAVTVVTSAPTVAPTAAPARRSATIRSIGEIAVQTNVLNAAYDKETDSYDFSAMFEHISDVMGDADYTVGDVEGSLGGTVKASGENTALCTPSSLIDALKDCGVDMLTLANDHALDGGADDLAAAIENCKNSGMEYIGAAATQEEKDTPKIIDINDIKVGFLAYTESMIGEMPANASYCVNKISSATSPSADVQALRDAGAEVIICYMSWGEMLNRSATSNQQIFAKALVSAGVDVIIGYNPHTIQPALWLEADGNRTLCLCATGNFLSDVREQYFDCGMIFQFTIQERPDYTGFDIENPIYIPTYVWRIANEDGTYDYRTMAVGQWLETQPEGIDYTQYTRLKQVWAEEQTTMGKDVATISAE